MTVDPRRRALTLGLIASVALAVGCRSDDPPASTTAADPAPRDQEPRRIASLTILSDDVLWGLGPEVRERVVGVSTLTDDPRYSAHPGRWPAELPRLGATAEPILTLDPDLSIVASFTAIETRNLLEAANVRTLTLGSFTGFEDYRDQVRQIGAAVGAPGPAEALVRSFDQRLAATPAPPAERPTVVSYNGGMVPGSGTTFHDEAVAAGFDNLPSLHGLAGHAQVTLEQIVSWDPEYIVVPCNRDCEAARANLVALPGLDATRAVRHDRIVPVESASLFATGPEMLDVVDALVRARRSP